MLRRSQELVKEITKHFQNHLFGNCLFYFFYLFLFEDQTVTISIDYFFDDDKILFDLIADSSRDIFTSAFPFVAFSIASARFLVISKPP